MPLHDHCFVINEGSLLLPAGYQDRTANIFVQADAAQGAFNLNIGRDTIEPEEALADYVGRQVGIMKEKISGYRLIGRQDAHLGSGEAAIAGEQIDASYRSANRTIHQRQAAFPLPNRNVLIFSATGAGAFGDHANAIWADWLASFTPRSAAPDGADAAPQASAPSAADEG